MKRIAIIIRVYNRVEDLRHNLEVIRRTWTGNDYEIFVTSNGAEKGFKVPHGCCDGEKCHLIELPGNPGHFAGNAQLLIEGAKRLDYSKYDYVIILEADTWLYGDAIVEKYVRKMSEKKAVWASARWYDKFHSLATDFAIIDAKFLAGNIGIFDFAQNPECYVSNYLRNQGAKYIYIRENMPPMLPSYMRRFRFPYAPNGRFYTFPASRMVTHHVEDYPGGKGMEIKKRHFNILATKQFFGDIPAENYAFGLLKMRLAHLLQNLLLRRSWYSPRKSWDPSEAETAEIKSNL